jgi:hypothetical protein
LAVHITHHHTIPAPNKFLLKTLDLGNENLIKFQNIDFVQIYGNLVDIHKNGNLQLKNVKILDSTIFNGFLLTNSQNLETNELYIENVEIYQRLFDIEANNEAVLNFTDITMTNITIQNAYSLINLANFYQIEIKIVHVTGFKVFGEK